MGSRSFGRARVIQVEEVGEGLKCNRKAYVTAAITADNFWLCFLERDGVELRRFPIQLLNSALLSPHTVAIQCRENVFESSDNSMLLRFDTPKEASEFSTALRLCQSLKPPSDKAATANGAEPGVSVFDARTEHASASQYFQFYGYLSQQQNMMQDYVRTSTYQRAIHVNSKDFRDKVVMDVGAGSGILSFFAAQAGASRVYAVEASTMAVHCAELVRSNNLSDQIIVVAGRVEDVTIPEQVDVIVSEPMGYMLVNERMLESYVHARKFLKPGGKMFPSRGDLHVALFNDEALYIEQSTKANFWCQENFHGVNVSSLRPQAIIEIFKQPVVDTWHVNILVSGSVKWSVDFEKDPESKLHKIEIPFELAATRSAHVHGIAFWFDVAFIGSTETVWLSTAPTEALTHWYQVRCLFDKPLMVFAGQIVKGYIKMIANEKQSYDVEIRGEAGGVTASNILDLKNPLFRYTGAAVVPPAGFSTESPSDALLQQNGLMGNSMELPMDGAMNGMTSAYNGISLMGNTHAVAEQLASAANHAVPPPPPPSSTDIIDIPCCARRKFRQSFLQRLGKSRVITDRSRSPHFREVAHSHSQMMQQGIPTVKHSH